MESTGVESAAGFTSRGPEASEVEGVFCALRADPLGEYLRLFAHYGDTVRLQLGPLLTHLMFHPDQVKQVLVTSAQSFDKETYGNRRLRSFTGRGLLFSEGAQWQRQRRVTQALLSSREHDLFARATREALLVNMRKWPETADAGGAVDVQERVARAMFVAIVRALISRELRDGEVVALRGALHDLLRESQRIRVPKVRHADGGTVDTFSAAAELMDGTILSAIRERAGKPMLPDFLGSLVARAQADGEPFSEPELLAQVKTMLLAGHDTAAHGVVFALYFLSRHPEWQQRVREESVLLAEGSALDAAAAHMKCTEAVALEALRLLPPIWGIQRRATEAVSVAGVSLPAGSAVSLSPYVTHRHPHFWQEPEAFRPERFLEPDTARHRYAYFPFGGGPRICVGNHVGMLQLKVALGTIIGNFRCELADEFSYTFEHMVVLRFLHGLPLKLSPVQ